MGALLTRVMRHVLRFGHTGGVCVSVGMAGLFMLQVLNVSLSWQKLAPGVFGLEAQARRPSLCRVSARRAAAGACAVFGAMLRVNQIKLMLRVFLAPIYAALRRPTSKLQSLDARQIGEVLSLLP